MSVCMAPVAPIGWPWAIELPSTLTMSSGNPRSRITASAIAANASLISKRSTSPISQPARAKSLLHGRHWTDAEHAWLDGADTPADQASEGL